MQERFSPVGREAYTEIYAHLVSTASRDLLDSIAVPLVGAEKEEQFKSIANAVYELENELLASGSTISEAFAKAFIFGDVLLDHMTALEAKREPWRSH